MLDIQHECRLRWRLMKVRSGRSHRGPFWFFNRCIVGDYFVCWLLLCYVPVCGVCAGFDGLWHGRSRLF